MPYYIFLLFHYLLLHKQQLVDLNGRLCPQQMKQLMDRKIC